MNANPETKGGVASLVAPVIDESCVLQGGEPLDARAEVRKCVSALWEPGAVGEVRILNAKRRCGTVSGYFTDVDAFVEEVMRWDGRAEGIYLTLNPVRDDLLARAANHAKEWAKATTSDELVLRRRWLLIDCDPVRPSGISSSDAEHQAALERARLVRDALVRESWPADAFILADSGNGAHVLVRIDLANDEAATKLVENVLAALAFRFDDEAVKIDTSVANAARISKCYGTLTCKGDPVEGRPHRRASIIEKPDVLVAVSREQLASLVSSVPFSAEPEPARGQKLFDLDEWLTRHSVPVVAQSAWRGGKKYVLDPCPWNSAHTNGSAYVVQFPSGAIAAGCHHDGCRGRGWYDLRDVYEPGWGEAAGAVDPPRGVSSFRSSLSSPPWPSPLAGEAFHGLAGFFVRTVEPHTESDPAAILLQFLCAVGNVCGRGPHWVVEGSEHYTNLFVVMVGQTSKARKGTSWGQVRRLLKMIDEAWTNERVASGLSSGEGLIDHVRDPRIEMENQAKKGDEDDWVPVTVDPGERDKRLLVIEEEFASPLKMMEREGNTLSPVLRNAWDGRPLQTMTKHSRSKATNRLISIVGHVTSDELRRYLTRTEMGNGFANRILWTCVRHSKFLPNGGSLREADLWSLATQLKDVVRWATSASIELPRDADAQRVWEAVYKPLVLPKPGLFGAVVGRGEAQAMRIACIYAVLDRSPLIRREHLLAALAVWDYCEASARYLFGQSLGDPAADAILQALRAQPEGLTRTSIHELFGRNKKKADVDRALGVLHARGLATLREETTKGRSAERWLAVEGTKETTETNEGTSYLALGRRVLELSLDPIDGARDADVESGSVESATWNADAPCAGSDGGLPTEHPARRTEQPAVESPEHEDSDLVSSEEAHGWREEDLDICDADRDYPHAYDDNADRDDPDVYYDDEEDQDEPDVYYYDDDQDDPSDYYPEEREDADLDRLDASDSDKDERP